MNFKSNYSYGDSTRTDFGDLNTDGIIETIKEELTKTDEGCIGFSPIGAGNKNSYFNGNNNTIKNIYIHRQNGNIALFYYAGDIKNLNLTGTVINDTWEAGGVAYNANNIENCINYANITGYNFVSGICARSCNQIIDCINYGNIITTGAAYLYGCASGIGSSTKGYVNCTNYGNISGKGYIGINGLIGISGQMIIDSCKNYGKIEGTDLNVSTTNGGIVGGHARRKFKNYKFI